MRSFLTCCCFTLLLVGSVGADNVIWVEDGAALPGTPDIRLGLYAKHDDVLHAFSAALRYDEAVLSFEELDLDGAGVVTGQVGYEYRQAIADEANGTLIVAVVLDFDSPFDHQEIPASPDDPQLLAHLVFSVVESADPGVYQIRPRNDIGSPRVENVFSVYGQSVLPELEIGTFTVENPHHLYLRDTAATIGGTAVVELEADHLDPIGGFQIVLRYPEDVLSIDTEPLDDPLYPVNPDDPNDFVEEDLCLWPVTFCGLGIEDYLGSDGAGIFPVESYFVWTVTDHDYEDFTPGVGAGRLLVAAVFDRNPPFRDQTLPPGRQKILRVIFDIVDTVQEDDVIPVTLVNGTGTPVLDNIFVVPLPDQPDVSVHPDLHSGAITIVDGFRRGYLNSDDKVDVGDVIFLLGYLFNSGREPLCIKAADANDDGRIDIGDGIRILGYLFGSNFPPMPPFEQCGGDPTPDTLTCETSVGCF